MKLAPGKEKKWPGILFSKNQNRIDFFIAVSCWLLWNNLCVCRKLNAMFSQEGFGKPSQIPLRFPQADCTKQIGDLSGTRSLKVEEDGDFSKGRIKPKIRLIGRWLERAGFKPGSRVLVKFVASGVIELRSSENSPPISPDEPFL